MPYWNVIITDPATASQGRRCARGERCLDCAPHPDTGQPAPAWPDATGDPFCGRDTRLIGRVLKGLPERWVALHMMLGAKTRLTDERVSGSRSAPIPVRVDVDALLRDMTASLRSWHERIAMAQSLARPRPRQVRDQVTVHSAVTTLTPRLEDLLRLRPAPMGRLLSMRAAAQLPEGTAGCVRVIDRQSKIPLFAAVTLTLSGASAGLEILELDYRARHLLGLTTAPPVRLEGVPCKRCDQLALEVAPEPEYKSYCAACGDLLKESEYADWVKLYSAWARQQIEALGVEPESYRDLLPAA